MIGIENFSRAFQVEVVFSVICPRNIEHKLHVVHRYGKFCSLRIDARKLVELFAEMLERILRPFLIGTALTKLFQLLCRAHRDLTRLAGL